MKTRKNHKLPTRTCCICRNQFIGFGSNPYPVKKRGVCCNRCDETVVIPERFNRINLENFKTKLELN